MLQEMTKLHPKGYLSNPVPDLDPVSALKNWAIIEQYLSQPELVAV